MRAVAQDREAAGLMERAIAKAPQDPWVAYRAAGAARTRARANELLSVFIDAAGAMCPRSNLRPSSSFAR